MSSPREIVYVNGGEIYKQPTPVELGQSYVLDPSADSIFSYRKLDGKQYLFTTEFKSYFNGGEGTSLDGIDLCPAVTLWICLGANTPEERTNFDIFFAIDSSAQLQEVADYYGLPYPITEEVANHIDTAPEELQFWNVEGRAVVPAGIKFIDGQPSIFKCYTYPKAFGKWYIWMTGTSYCNGGQVWEDGGSYMYQTGGEAIPNLNMREARSFTKAELLYTERADGVKTSYSFTRLGDPLMMWEGREYDDSGNFLRTKKYESGSAIRLAIAKMTNGPTFEDRDLCPDVAIWLGRSFYEDSDSEELMYVVTDGSEQVNAVSAYYGLQTPLDDGLASTLDNDIESIRARHYDLYELGEGNWVPVVVGSICFENGEPVRSLLYAFRRPWEYEEDLTPPDPRSFLSQIT
jgi:hypothetical protein